MFEKLFCKHNWLILRQTNILSYPDYSYAQINGEYLCDKLKLEVQIICTKCGKRKILYSKNTEIYWRVNFADLSDSELIEYETNTKLFKKKIQKKYGININYYY